MPDEPESPREILKRYALALMENARNAASNDDEYEISGDLLQMMGVMEENGAAVSNRSLNFSNRRSSGVPNGPKTNVSAGEETQLKAPTRETHSGHPLLPRWKSRASATGKLETNPMWAGVYPRTDRGLQGRGHRRH